MQTQHSEPNFAGQVESTASNVETLSQQQPERVESSVNGRDAASKMPQMPTGLPKGALYKAVNEIIEDGSKSPEEKLKAIEDLMLKHIADARQLHVKTYEHASESDKYKFARFVLQGIVYSRFFEEFSKFLAGGDDVHDYFKQFIGESGEIIIRDAYNTIQHSFNTIVILPGRFAETPDIDVSKFEPKPVIVHYLDTNNNLVTIQIDENGSIGEPKLGVLEIGLASLVQSLIKNIVKDLYTSTSSSSRHLFDPRLVEVLLTIPEDKEYVIRGFIDQQLSNPTNESRRVIDNFLVPIRELIDNGDIQPKVMQHLRTLLINFILTQNCFFEMDVYMQFDKLIEYIQTSHLVSERIRDTGIITRLVSALLQSRGKFIEILPLLNNIQDSITRERLFKFLKENPSYNPLRNLPQASLLDTPIQTFNDFYDQVISYAVTMMIRSYLRERVCVKNGLPLTKDELTKIFSSRESDLISFFQSHREDFNRYLNEAIRVLSIFATRPLAVLNNAASALTQQYEEGITFLGIDCSINGKHLIELLRESTQSLSVVGNSGVAGGTDRDKLANPMQQVLVGCPAFVFNDFVKPPRLYNLLRHLMLKRLGAEGHQVEA